MRYREIAPAPALADHVHCYWMLEHDPGPEPREEPILPDGRVEWIFGFGAPYRRRDERGGLVGQPRSMVVGQIRRAVSVVAVDRVEAFGVRFHPTGAHAFLRESMHLLADQSVAVEDLGVPLLRELERRLEDADGWNERLQVAETLLLRAAAGLRRGDALVGAALRHLLDANGNRSVPELARATGASRRTLERGFLREVGLTPGLFGRQVRFHSVFRELRSGQQADWAALALRVGCYDQAHLIREFRTFAGESPAAFLRQQHELSDHLTGLAGEVGASSTSTSISRRSGRSSSPS